MRLRISWPAQGAPDGLALLGRMARGRLVEAAEGRVHRCGGGCARRLEHVGVDEPDRLRGIADPEGDLVGAVSQIETGNEQCRKLRSRSGAEGRGVDYSVGVAMGSVARAAA